jgi:hypothetical protein
MLFILEQIGPGFMVNVTEHVAFIAKGNMHFVFNKLKRPGGFLTASGGIGELYFPHSCLKPCQVPKPVRLLNSPILIRYLKL